jgi:starch-binding outer membrane protein, SusD/RagB family
MTTHSKSQRVTPVLRRTVGVVSLLALIALPLACNQLDKALAVESPSRLPVKDLEKPETAELLVRSSSTDFKCALGAFVVAGGLMSGELVDATQTASRWIYDRRVIVPADAQYSTSICEAIGVYSPISTARWTADNALRHLEGWTDAQVPDRQKLMAQAALNAGFSLIMLGEAFCSAAVDLSAEETPAQLFAQAEDRFTRAIAAATASGDNNLLNAAYVGLARSRIDRNDKAGAAADAARVPIDFVFLSDGGDVGRQQNRVFEQNNKSLAVSVAPAYRNVVYGTTADPRVNVRNEGRNGQDASTPLFTQQKYASLGAPLVVASGVEAQLILAEAQGGAAAVNIINALHARAGLPQDFASTDPVVILAQIIEERRRELFLQGNRLFDVNRFNLTQVPSPGLAYPKGGSYGTQRCMPLPDVERLNNPNIPDA